MSSGLWESVENEVVLSMAPQVRDQEVGLLVITSTTELVFLEEHWDVEKLMLGPVGKELGNSTLVSHGWTIDEAEIGKESVLGGLEDLIDTS